MTDADRLEDLVAEFIERREAGEALDPAGFAAAHPDVAAALHAALLRVEDAFGLFPLPDRDLAAGLPEQVGPYRVIGEIGRGGMGHVLEVTAPEHPDAALALKLLSTPAWLNPRAVDRLRREGEVLQRLAHPGIVRILEVGAADGLPYLLMERIAGGSLAARLRAAGPPGVDWSVRCIAAVARAVDAAHREGLLHRDIKPGNIMLRADDTPVLIDFGLAGGDAGPTLTRTGDVLGTPHYMAPEQALGGAVTSAVDVYGLGAVLFELLTGRTPHEGSDPASVLHAVRTQPVAPLRKIAADLPRDLETIVLRAMAFRPERRYPDAGALAVDLEALAAGAAIRASRPSLRERSADAWRFHGRAVALSVAAVLLVCVVTLLVWFNRGDTAAAQRVALDAVATAWAARDRAALAQGVQAYAEADPPPALLAAMRWLAAADAPSPEVPEGTLAGDVVAGLRQYRRKDYPAAIATMQRVIDAAPGLLLPVVVRGFAARRAKQLDVAEAELLAALRRVPRSLPIREELTRVYRSGRRHREAIRVVRAGLAIDPDDAELWHDLAQLLYNVQLSVPREEQDFGEALAAAQKAMDHAPRPVRSALRRTYGQMLDKNKRFAEAQAIFQEFLAADPDNDGDRFRLAYSYDSAHRFLDAKRQYEELCRRLPKATRPRLCLAHLYAGSDLNCAQCKSYFAQHPEMIDFVRAEKLLLEAIELDGGRDLVCVNAAVDVALRIERRDAAVALLGRLIEAATDAGDDRWIAGLVKARRRLTK